MTQQTKTSQAPNTEGGPEPAAWTQKLQRPGVLCVLLAVVTLAVYLPVARHGYVNYDDSDYVTSNAQVQSGLKWENVVWAFQSGHASNWHPLTWISHMLDIQLFGQNPGVHHLVSVAMHIANTLLLFLLLRRITGLRHAGVQGCAPAGCVSGLPDSKTSVTASATQVGALWRSYLVAALFALHPLHVESVAWVSERKDVLSGFFFLLTLLAYARYAQCRMQNAECRITQHAARNTDEGSLITDHRSLFYLLSLVLFALGLMSKPMLVTVPFVLLLLDYWPLQRWRQIAPWRLVAEKAPFFLLAVGSCVVTFMVQRRGGAVSTVLSLGARIANALVSYVRYLGKTFLPNDLSVLYPHPGHWPMWQVIACAAVLLAVLAAVLWLARSRPYLPMGWLWFCGMLVPVIGLVQVGIQSMADRYTYLPLIGLFIILVWGLADLVPPRPWRAQALTVASVFLCLACALLTWRQVGIWRDSEALFRNAVRVTRDNYLAYNNLGFYLWGQGRKTEAIEYYRLALKINPAYEDALNNLGYALADQKKFLEAIPLYEAALRVRPRHAEVHNNLGNALSETGRIDEAINHYQIVLEQNPNHADAHNNLGIALAMKNRLDEAITHFRAAIRAKPDYASAHSNLGNAFAVQHKLEEAIQEYQEALRLKPADAQAHNNLGNALAEQGKLPEAIEHYREALRLNADNPEAHFNLGMSLLRLGQRDEAARHFTEALRLKPNYADARKQLESLSLPPPPSHGPR